MITGSCLCGSVTWQVDGALDKMRHCHCSMCRKAHGAPFATYVQAKRDEFRWLSGEVAITAYESSPGQIRNFCGNCGSVVPEFFRTDRISIPAGCLDGDPGIRPSAHIFVASKAPWYEITDDLLQFDGDPDGGPTVDLPPHIQSEDGLLRGSCLCGDVAYTVSTPFKAAHNCHCQRCRKARAAAHGTNGFTSADGLAFVRGEESLRDYKVPEAKFFRQVFCVRCGSGLPRKDPERGVAIIPLASFDDDPHYRAEDNIFVAFKAPWFTITDRLPSYDIRP